MMFSSICGTYLAYIKKRSSTNFFLVLQNRISIPAIQCVVTNQLINGVYRQMNTRSVCYVVQLCTAQGFIVEVIGIEMLRLANQSHCFKARFGCPNVEDLCVSLGCKTGRAHLHEELLETTAHCTLTHYSHREYHMLIERVNNDTNKQNQLSCALGASNVVVDGIACRMLHRRILIVSVGSEGLLMIIILVVLLRSPISHLRHISLVFRVFDHAHGSPAGFTRANACARV